MYELITAGRNEPCPCGSGRKFKKCCRDAQEAAIAPDIATLVDDCIAADDWSPLYSPVDLAMTFFEAGAPLEHVRLPGEGSDHVNRCTAGWLGWCERELAHVLTARSLRPGDRHALQVAAYLSRRFGARSPIVEELAELQAAEHAERLGRLREALVAAGITSTSAVDALPDDGALAMWLLSRKPALLAFADALVLRLAPPERLAAVWHGGTSRQVIDRCLDGLEDGARDEDRDPLIALAAFLLAGGGARLVGILVHFTPLWQPLPGEQAAYELVQSGAILSLGARIGEILRAREQRGDFAAAALLREALRVQQRRSRVSGA